MVSSRVARYNLKSAVASNVRDESAWWQMMGDPIRLAVRVSFVVRSDSEGGLKVDSAVIDLHVG